VYYRASQNVDLAFCSSFLLVLVLNNSENSENEEEDEND
jgi:hypothetical protein